MVAYNNGIQSIRLTNNNALILLLAQITLPSLDALSVSPGEPPLPLRPRRPVGPRLARLGDEEAGQYRP
jgi:hypothetical protein